MESLNPAIQQSLRRLEVLLDAVQVEIDYLRTLTMNMEQTYTMQPDCFCGDLPRDLVRRRKAMGMTQQELAEKIGVGRTTVTMWETGAGNPRIQVLPALARALRCTVDELLEAEVSKE